MASLNPIKAIEDFINEHGSSVIQEKHIAFLRDQVALFKEQILDRDATISDRDVTISKLTAENINLKLQLPKKELPKQKVAVDDESIRILALLFRADEFVRITQIASSTEIPQHIVSGILSDLVVRHFVTCDHLRASLPVTGSVDGYKITSEGKAFMMQNHRDKLQ